MLVKESKDTTAIELFYSYSHKDKQLCDLLETHLKALQRSGLIRSWYDRKINPGTEWSEQIQQAMERAGIILLLVSPDFMESDYCYEIELPFAMKRHESGDAIVIPILLRPVVYQDTPFAKLQMLPKGARPVIEWGRRDKAFNDIAAAIRSIIIEKRLHPDGTTTNQQLESQGRVLDAAVPQKVYVKEPADVVALIRLPDSKGLRTVLQYDDSYSVSSEDVKSSEEFEIQFPRDTNRKLLPASVELELQASGFEPPKQTKKVRLRLNGDAPVCVFMLTPQREGRLSLNLNVVVDGQLIASRRLVTTAINEIHSDVAVIPTSYQVVEMPLNTKPQSMFPSIEQLEPSKFDCNEDYNLTEAEPESVSEQICFCCGALLKPGKKFCSRCGSPFASEKLSVCAEQTSMPPTPKMMKPPIATREQPSSYTSANTSLNYFSIRKFVAIFGVIFIGLIVGAFISWNTIISTDDIHYVIKPETSILLVQRVVNITSVEPFLSVHNRLWDADNDRDNFGNFYPDGGIYFNAGYNVISGLYGSEIRFETGRKYSHFTGKIVLPNEYNNKFREVNYFIIHDENKELYKSPMMQAGMDPFVFDIDISKSDKIIIEYKVIDGIGLIIAPNIVNAGLVNAFLHL